MPKFKLSSRFAMQGFRIFGILATFSGERERALVWRTDKAFNKTVTAQSSALAYGKHCCAKSSAPKMI